MNNYSNTTVKCWQSVKKFWKKIPLFICLRHVANCDQITMTIMNTITIPQDGVEWNTNSQHNNAYINRDDLLFGSRINFRLTVIYLR